MRLGAPTLRVSQIKDVLEFYQGVFGLVKKAVYRSPGDGLEVFELGFRTSPEPLLVIRHDPKARPKGYDFAGLYHYAVVLPTRKSLASSYLTIGSSGTVFDGFADHHVSEALYLHDTERNGIEVYADKSPETWSAFNVASGGPRDTAMRRFASLNRPLDFDSLLAELSKDERANPSAFPSGARIGHIHLRVTDLQRSVKFYNERLGLDIVANLPEIGAAFLSVGGYHHHIGLNTWESDRGTPHQRGEAGLDHFTIHVPGDETLERLKDGLEPSSHLSDEGASGLTISDPDGIEIRVRAEGHQ